MHKIVDKVSVWRSTTSTDLDGLPMEIPQSQVHRALHDHLQPLREMVGQAVSDYQVLYSPYLRSVHTTRTKASAIHDHFFHHARAYAEKTLGVRFEQVQKLCMLQFSEGFIVRFKKMDKDLLPSGHLTKQVVRFRTHQALEGLPDSVHLDLGYEEGVLGDLQSVYLICPSGPRSNMWVSELNDEAPAATTVVSLFGASNTTIEEPAGATIATKAKQDKRNETQPGNGDSGA
ncbi:hypothetical protein ACW7G0_08400 [Lysobacter sp. A286]